MKNIHILPTDQPSRLYLEYGDGDLCLANNPLPQTSRSNNQHIYITSDEVIKEGDWFIHYSHNITSLHQAKSVVPESIITTNDEGCWMVNSKKIILTTDPTLIADGVQAIDDEFLKWFVKNSSCEYAEVNDWLDGNGNIAFRGKRYQICNHFRDKKTIIPQEDHKQDLEKDWKELEDANLCEPLKSWDEPHEQDPCNFCGKTLREQMKGCGEITCYRQFITKQETLEEAAEHNYPGGDVWTEEQAVIRRLAFKNGAKWQAEQNENVFRSFIRTHHLTALWDKWFKQFKKK